MIGGALARWLMWSEATLCLFTKTTFAVSCGASRWVLENVAETSHRPHASWDRNDAIRQIDRRGRQAWKEHSGYHRRSLAETAVSRLQGAFGERLKNRELRNQKTEVALRSKLLNWFVLLGMPLSMWI